MIALTDAQRAFADSPRGRSMLAKAQRDHHTRHAYLGSLAPAWTDAMEAAATRDAATATARENLSRAVADATLPADTANARAARDTALAMRADEIRNAWRSRP